jgi:hypothetical protein
LLSQLHKNRKLYAVSGSGYHDSIDVRLDKIVIERLGGEYLGFLANIPIKNTKRIIQILHGVSSASVYREMIMARDGLFLWAAEGRNKLPFHIDIRITGHWHYFTHIHSERQHLLQLPGWTDWIPWKGGLHTYGKMLPDIGACIILIDTKDRISVFPFLYERPLIADGLKKES